jgi:hypothetical protein
MAVIVKVCRKHGELTLQQCHILRRNNRPTYLCIECRKIIKERYNRRCKIRKLIARNNAPPSSRNFPEGYVTHCSKHGFLTLEHVNKNGYEGRKQRYKCKQCQIGYRQNNYAKNKKNILARNQQYRIANYDKYLLIKSNSARKINQYIREHYLPPNYKPGTIVGKLLMQFAKMLYKIDKVLKHGN